MNLLRKLAVAIVAVVCMPAAHADLIVASANPPETSTITFGGIVLTGPTAGTDVYGIAKIPNGLPDLIPGSFEDWWEIFGFAEFSYAVDGISFSTTTGRHSSLRIKDKIDEDGLRFDASAGQSGQSLLLILSRGDSEALFPGSGGLTGNVPILSADPTLFVPCQQTNGSWAGSCSQIATIEALYLFQLTEFSITRTIQVPEPGTLALFGLGLFALVLRRRHALLIVHRMLP